MEKRISLIVSDYLSSFVEYPLKATYAQLYEDLVEDSNIAQLFAILHQKLNELFGHMNNKSKTNSHYNAQESRDLLDVIDKIDGLKQTLKSTKYNFILQKEYATKLKEAEAFLEEYNGSLIPESYIKLEVTKYDPIFYFTTTSVNIPARSENVDLKLVGEGAFALVHKFTDPYYQKTFAKKTLKASTTDREQERFLEEYNIMKEMHFPYILEVHQLIDDGNAYIMEYCESSLEEYIFANNTNLSFEIRKRIALQFLYAINYIHSKGLLHRDISLKNILIQKYDKGAVAIKLSDFGLVKDQTSTFTKSDTEYKGSIVDPTIDPSVDKFKDYNVKNEMYAIGVVLQYIFTGRKSIEHSKVMENMRPIIIKCTDTNLKKRYSKVATIIKDIEQLLSQ